MRTLKVINTNAKNLYEALGFVAEDGTKRIDEILKKGSEVDKAILSIAYYLQRYNYETLFIGAVLSALTGIKDLFLMDINNLSDFGATELHFNIKILDYFLKTLSDEELISIGKVVQAIDTLKEFEKNGGDLLNELLGKLDNKDF